MDTGLTKYDKEREFLSALLKKQFDYLISEHEKEREILLKKLNKLENDYQSLIGKYNKTNNQLNTLLELINMLR